MAASRPRSKPMSGCGEIAVAIPDKIKEPPSNPILVARVPAIGKPPGTRVKATKGKGCPKCKDSGYKGRMGIYEVMKVTKPIKEAILKQATTPELKAIAIKEGFQTMQDMGRKMIAAGDLNFREYERVLSG